jgi:hypothetical protein
VPQNRPVWFFAAAVVVCASACSDPSPPKRAIDAGRRPRVLAPPPGQVRAAPPHAIHRDGVGPFVLGKSLSDTLSLLAVPRVVLYQLDGVVDYSLVRAEEDALVIGVSSPGGVAYVTVHDKDIGKHETGVGVGADRAILHKALGKPLTWPGRVGDPRIEAFAPLPNARFVVEKGRVSNVLVGLADRPRRKPRTPPGTGARDAGVAKSEPLCAKPSSPSREEVLRVARLGGGKQAARLLTGCFAGDAPDSLVFNRSGFVVVDVEGKKVRRLTGLPVSGLMWAAPLDSDGDGRDEIAVVTRSGTTNKLAFWVALYRVDGSRLIKLVGQAAYQISATRASWVGATLDRIELLIELRTTPGALMVGGLYVHRGAPRPVNVAPLQAKRLLIKLPRKPATGASAAARDAGTDGPRDAGRSKASRTDARMPAKPRRR